MCEFSSSELNKLLIIQYKLEKSINYLLPLFNKFDLDLLEYFTKLEEKRLSEKQSIQEQLKEIQCEVHCKLDLLHNNKLDGVSDFKQFKKEMICIQDNIQNLKVDSRLKLDQLIRKNNEIYEDIDYYSAKILEWSEPVKISIYNSVQQRIFAAKYNKPHCKEVKDFIEFLHANGGHENGWRREDHQLFIKFRKKYKNGDLVAHNLHEALPDINLEEVNLHEEWYKKYLMLEKAKREAIKAWKKCKTNAKNPMVKENVISKPRILSHAQNKQDVQEQLNKWKLEKELKIQFTKETELCIENRKRQLAELRKQRQNELKKIVNEWRDIKNTMEQKARLAKISMNKSEKKKRSIEANRLIKQFQSQDDMYIAKVKQLKKRQEFKVPVRSKSSQIVDRDPNRLLRPTKQWINRVHDETVYPMGFANVLPLNKLPKLRIPEWKKVVQ